MSVYSITALDRLIESGRGSSTAKQMSPSAEQGYSTEVERSPYTVFRFSVNTLKEKRPPRPRSPSPSDSSPSPHVVNCKRREPSHVNAERASQQNGFSVTEQTSADQSMECSDPATVFSKEKVLVDKHACNGVSERHRSKLNVPQNSLNREFSSESRRKDREISMKNKGEKFSPVRLLTTEERWTGGEKREVSFRTGELWGKQKLDGKWDEAARALERVKCTLASTSCSSVLPPQPKSSNVSVASTEEWFDAADFSFSDSDDEGLRTSTKPVNSAGGDPVAFQLAEEIKRRSRAEEALKELQRQRDGMVRMLCSAGVSLPHSDVIQSGDDALEVGLANFVAQRTTVARMVALAVLRGAARAETEAQLQSILAEKSKENARLRDKLLYYETLSREMSRRNQETIEAARQTRRRRQRRNRFALLSLSAAICLGISAAVAYQYVPWEQITSCVEGSGENILPEACEKIQ